MNICTLNWRNFGGLCRKWLKNEGKWRIDVSATPSREEIEIAVNLLVDRYGISAKRLGTLFNRKYINEIRQLYFLFTNERCGRRKLAELLVYQHGSMLFAGKTGRALRRDILEAVDEETVIRLYKSNTNGTKKSLSYMRTELVKKPWRQGQRWARVFVQTFGFPMVFAGIRPEANPESVVDVSPRKRLPKLVEFQVVLKDEMLKVLSLKGRETRCIVTLPTGGGKTRVAVEAFIEWMQPRFSQQQYLIWVAQSEELCEQAISCIEALWSNQYFVEDLRIYRYFGGRKLEVDQLIGGVVVTSIQQLYKRMISNDPVLSEIFRNIGAMIIDEAHRAATHMYREVLKFAERYAGDELFPICGLTATPGRSGDGTKNLVEFFKAQLITPKLGEEYEKKPLQYFRQHGYLAWARHKTVKSDTVVDLSEEELEAFRNEDLFIEHQFLKDLARNTQRNAKILEILLKAIPKDSRVLVYACTVEHAEMLSAMLNAFGRRSAAISAKTPAVIRRMLLEEFKEGNIEFIFNYGVLTTGFDAPKTDHIVLLRPTTSVVLYEQIVGRGLRGPKFGGTTECTVIDFADNILRLGVPLAYKRFADEWPDFWSSEEVITTGAGIREAAATRAARRPR